MKPDLNGVKSSVDVYLSVAVISVSALGATFALSALDLPLSLKAVFFSLIVVLYLALLASYYVLTEKRSPGTDSPLEDEKAFSPEIEEKLQILEEASEFFAASLKPADMFRLIAGRVGDIIPFASCVLFLTNEQKSHLKISHAIGTNAAALKNLCIINSEGLAGKAFRSRRPQIEAQLIEDKKVFSRETLLDLESAVAVPLSKGGEVFGVLQLFGASDKAFGRDSLLLLEAIGERIIPLLIGSLSVERNLSSAMTDSLTSLPNERAFYLVLENQIAEAQRLPEKRNLTVLVMDISNFDEINKSYGHSTGDKILAFTAQTIKNQLRQMDFLSRSMNDEFFAVLPTAEREIAEKIIRRIEKTFFQQSFQIAEKSVNVKLNFGFATFNIEGETADQLLKNALLKKRRSKSPADANVLRFPKEFVN